MLLLLHKILTNKNRDMFMVRLAATLLLGKLNITGVLATLLGRFLAGILGVFLEEGILLIDLTLDSYREGGKLKEFEKAATEAYKKATAQVYDETKKKEIRRQYLEIISRIGTVGDGPK